MQGRSLLWLLAALGVGVAAAAPAAAKDLPRGGAVMVHVIGPARHAEMPRLFRHRHRLIEAFGVVEPGAMPLVDADAVASVDPAPPVSPDALADTRLSVEQTAAGVSIVRGPAIGPRSSVEQTAEGVTIVRGP